MTETFGELAPWLGLSALILGSGFFSASETALFSLDSGSRPRAGRLAVKLLEHPRDLLIEILIGNLLVNVSFFAFAPRVLASAGVENPLTAGLIALMVIVLGGEILPKTLALRASVPIARLAALPLSLGMPFLRHVGRAVSALLDMALRTLGEAAQPESPISAEALAEVLEKSADQGVLAVGEADLLSEIVELTSLRVREIMTPRVDALVLDLEDSENDPSAILREALVRKQDWLPVVRGGADNVVGQMQLRQLATLGGRPLSQLVMPVKFVPEVAPVLATLQSMREDRVGEAVVVDEWGGMAGIVTLEDIFEELVGELRVEGEDLVKPVVPLGEGRFRVAGSLSIRDWNEAFRARLVPTEFETLAGFVTAMLGRIPKQGDRIELEGGLFVEVDEVRGRRVLSVQIYLDEEGARDAASERRRGA